MLRQLGLLLVFPIPAFANQYNLQTPVTTVAHSIYNLHTLLLYITGAIVVVVFGVMFYAIFKHRKAAGHTAKQFHENITVEIIWTIVPFLILIGMAIPATKAILMQKNTKSPDITIKVTGYQWKWHYDYLEDGFGFMSQLATPKDQLTGTTAKRSPEYLLDVNEPLVVPTGKRIRLLLTANDVIHAWWVPALGVKQDAIPGFIRDTWFKIDKPGTYRGQCAELCGKDHGYMPIVVIAKSPEDYSQWLEAKKKEMAANQDDPNKVWSLAALKDRGQKVYQQNCASCHMENGKGIPGTFPALDGSALILRSVNEHINIVLNGSQKNAAMAAWGKQLSDTDIAAVVTYKRNAWSNNTGQVVQPKDIKAARGG